MIVHRLSRGVRVAQADRLGQLAVTFQHDGVMGVALNLGLAAKRAGREDEAKNIASQLRQALGEDNQFKPILDEMEE